MKKRMSQRAGWIFVAVFVGLHLLYCALDLMRGLIIRTPPHTIDTPIYRAVERPLMVLQLFFGGPQLEGGRYGYGWGNSIAGHCWQLPDRSFCSGVHPVAEGSLWLAEDVFVLGDSTGTLRFFVQMHGGRGGRNGRGNEPAALPAVLYGSPFAQRQVCFAVPDPFLVALWRAAEDFSGCCGRRAKWF